MLALMLSFPSSIIACGGGGAGSRPATYAISGTASGAASSGVTIALTGASSATTTTDGSGNYSFAGLANGNYAVTPSKAGCTFSPPSLSPTINNADATGQNFTAATTAATLSSISVGPAPATVAAGYVRQFTATGIYSDGSSQDVTTSVTWTPSNGAVASVSSVGLATGLSTGSALITATLGAVSGSTTLTVQDPPVFDCCVNAIATGPDGTIYVGGSFTQVGPATGSGVPIDVVTAQKAAVFPKVNGFVYATAPDGSGGWFIGGSFTNVGGVARKNVAHIKSDGTVDGAWNPSADDQVNALAVSSGTVYAGGRFTNIGGQTRAYIAALDASSGNTTAWSPNGANFWVNALAVSGSTVYAGGHFATMGPKATGAFTALSQ
jgi:Bacterial Ig-like domain (group 2)/SdrD B-like domain/Domain of unknown function (DUF5122) beta-propeller